MRKIVFNRLVSVGILLTLTACFKLYAASIKIKVSDAQDHSPLPFAQIHIDVEKKNFVTDADGVLSLNLTQFPASATISYVGYVTTHLHLTARQTDYQVLLEPNSFMLDSIHVVGKRSLNQRTSNIVLVEQHVISRTQGQSLAAMLANLPGMRVLSTGAMIEKPIIEGMSGSRIAIVDNDTKLMGQHWGDDHAPELSIPSYAEVRVEKGAESVKYGANAIGGIIVVDTDINPTDTQRSGSVHSSYTFNGRMYGADFNWKDHIRLNKGLGYRISGKYYRSGDYSTADYLLYNTGSKLFDLKADIGWKWNDRWSLQQHWGYYDAEIGIFSGSHISTLDALLLRFEQGRPSADEIMPFSYDIAAPKQHIIHFTSNTQVSGQLTRDDQLNMRASFQSDYRREYENRRGNYTNLPTFAFKLLTLNLHTDWKHRFTTNRQLETGVDYFFINNITDNDTKSVPIIPNYISHNAALYGVYNAKINQKLTWEAGARFDYQYLSAAGYDNYARFYGGTKYYASVSGTVGMKYILNHHSNLQSNLGLAWRAPEMNELFSNGIHHGDAVFQVGDSNLRTEKALKWTVGYHLKHDWLDIRANLFAHYIHDFIYDVPHYTVEDGRRVPQVKTLLSGTFPIYYFEQSNGLFAGGELVATFQMGKHFSYEISGEWMRARNLSLNTYFPNIPSDRYRHELSYRTNIGKWQLEGDLHHQYVTKQRDFDPDIDLLPDTPPAYHLLGFDLSLKRKWGAHQLEFYTQTTNALNALYKDYTNRMRFFAHDKGRSTTVGLRYSF